jgi:hypothetical protein
MRTIADPDKYMIRVILRGDGRTWTWHILKAGRNPRAGKAMPVQRAVRMYRSEEEAQATGDVVLTEFLAALKLVEAKRR